MCGYQNKGQDDIYDERHVTVQFECMYLLEKGDKNRYESYKKLQERNGQFSEEHE